MLSKFTVLIGCLLAPLSVPAARAEAPPPSLRVGRAGHAFDHLGGINDQAAVAAASGATIIYAGGVGALGYEGLPTEAELAPRHAVLRRYNRDAKKQGVELVIGYLCATSIVKLDTFDKNWSPEFRAGFKTPPAQWRQVDRQGNLLASWYGGDYNPACMNHPDWRTYEEHLVRQTLETGHDGVFFDNPTVHAQGCYCTHCMEKFAVNLEQNGVASPLPVSGSSDRTEAIRQLADAHPKEFLRFRATAARDFLAHLRSFARNIKPDALITCNNSLNTPDQFFAQCRTLAYNINELSKAEDFVVVEDMATQPRTDASGVMHEYGHMYELLHAISHGKPIIACTIAGADYHTAPNLVRLAMAEAAAHGASYLSWPTWPEDQRTRMTTAIRPQADFLASNEELLNDAPVRDDVVLFLPFRNWVDSEQCPAMNLAAALTRANIQYRATSEDDFAIQRDGKTQPVFVVESRSVFTPEELRLVGQFEQQGGQVVVADNPDWFATLQAALTRPSITLDGPATVRAVVRDQGDRTIVHLYNLNIERISSFEDRITPATEVKLTVRVPRKSVGEVDLRTADKNAAAGPLKFTTREEDGGTLVDVEVPRLDVSAILVITP